MEITKITSLVWHNPLAMKFFLGISLVLLLLTSCLPAVDEPEWVSIFNGQNMEGWSPKFYGHSLGENYKNTFQVKEGLLQVNYAEYDSFRLEFGHLFYKEELQYYRLRFEYRFLGDILPGTPSWAIRNSGIMLYSQAATSMKMDQDFPVSLEAQLLGAYKDDGRSRPTGNLCTPGTVVKQGGKILRDHCNVGSGPTIFGDGWVQFEVAVLPNGMFHHLVEGDTVISYSDPTVGGDNIPFDYPVPNGTLLTKGYISLQAEGHPVEFRNIELMKLEAK